jgi:hypothetical protein
MFREKNNAVLVSRGLHPEIVTQLFRFPNGYLRRFALI